MKKPDPEKKKHAKNEISLPEGYEIPPTDEGKTWEEVVEIRKDPDGRYCVVAVAGIPIEDEEKEGEEGDAEEPLGNRAKAAMTGGSYG